MRVLLYNFVQPEEAGAGGVGVYLNNLAKALARDNDVILLSSGDRYSPTSREPRVTFSRDAYHRAVIVNSPVIAPAAYSFGDPDTYRSSTQIDFVPDMLFKKYGKIDVFHFQNIEGLTRSFFVALKDAFPEARLIYSVHNYHPVCPRVSLWYQDRVVCEDYRDGAACTMCLAPIFDPHYIRNRRRLIWVEKAYPRATAALAPVLHLAKLARRSLVKRRARADTADAVSTQGQTVAPIDAPSDVPLAIPSRVPPATSYAGFRNDNIALFRDVFDQVLAVSERTGKVFVDRGVPAAKVAVSYIGTAHKEKYLTSTKIIDIGSGLHLGYIGYMGTDKGFNFLLDCLERVPADIAAGITVTIAARNTFPDRHERMEEIGRRFKTLRYFDGYTHANLDAVLDGVNLGLIPVLWEDNLPQTAIELVSRGIPILTSDRGGAQEIAKNASFIFQAGNEEDMVDRLSRISKRELSLGAFWESDIQVFSMNEHVQDLMRYYAPDR
ncbi:MAG: glycosyltransferase [Sphingomonas sp.]|nr:MAG: glycosyltransferase [Sphingomonas sp.]